jgi:hypothetical protein
MKYNVLRLSSICKRQINIHTLYWYCVFESRIKHTYVNVQVPKFLFCICGGVSGGLHIIGVSKIPKELTSELFSLT